MQARLTVGTVSDVPTVVKSLGSRWAVAAVGTCSVRSNHGWDESREVELSQSFPAREVEHLMKLQGMILKAVTK